MGDLIIQDSKGTQIRTLEDWLALAPPKMGSRHWRDGRSAKEQARAWLSPRVPCELLALFRTHPATKDLVLTCAIPELQIRLDNYRGEHRNADLVAFGHAGEKGILVTIEAKADEEFGPPIGDYYDEAVKEARSKVPDRIEGLAKAIMGRSVDGPIRRLRYQLLHGVAGTLIEAKKRGAAQAVFVVHEFLSDGLDPIKLDRNHADFVAFVHGLPGCGEVDIQTGVMMGPIAIPGGGLVPGDIPLFIGKAVRHV